MTEISDNLTLNVNVVPIVKIGKKKDPGNYWSHLPGRELLYFNWVISLADCGDVVDGTTSAILSDKASHVILISKLIKLGLDVGLQLA